MTGETKKKQGPTSFTRAAEVSGTRAVAHVAVPALPADAVVLARVAQALFGRLLGAGGLNPRGLLDLRQASHVLALTVDEEIADAAHVAVVEQRRPHLRGEHQAHLVLRQTPEVKVVVQVQDLALAGGRVGSAEGVDGDGACEKKKKILCRFLFSKLVHPPVKSALTLFTIWINYNKIVFNYLAADVNPVLQ